MDDILIPSIGIPDINMDLCFFNSGCAQSIYKMASGIRMLDLLQKYFGPVKLHEICCRHDPRLPQGSTIINCCAGCDRRFRSQYEGIQTISLWEILDGIEHLPLPDHSGLTVSIQDSCSYRPKPQVHKAVRNILRKGQRMATGKHAVTFICDDSGFDANMNNGYTTNYPNFKFVG